MTSDSLLFEFYRSALPSVRERPLSTMPPTLFGYVVGVSGKQQIRLCLLTILVFPLTLAPLELQRRLINDAIAGSDFGLLVTLGVIYLVALLLHGGLKYLRSIYQDRISEGVARLLRRRMSLAESFGAEADEGTKQAIVSSEAERVGGFVGESIAFPLLQIGIILSVAVYMIVVEPLIAAVALSFLIPSLIVVLWLQPILDRLSERKTMTVRELAERLLGSAGGDGGEGGSADRLIERIYRLRIRLSLLKHVVKLLTNLFGKLGPLSVLVVGGWLAMRGQTEVGTLVAFISGYERMTGPARDLLNFYRRLSIMRVQYGLVRKVGQGTEQP